jgi:hypothetical protein
MPGRHLYDLQFTLEPSVYFINCAVCNNLEFSLVSLFIYEQSLCIHAVRCIVWYSPHFTRKSLRGGGGVVSGADRGGRVLVGGLKGCDWGKTVLRIRELHYYID